MIGVSTLIVLVVCVFLLFAYMKIEHHGRKVKIVVGIVIGFLIYFSIVGVFSSDQIELNSPKGIVNAVYVYFGWLGQTASGLWDVGVETVNMVGDVIKIDNSSKREDGRR
ncbi:hypothetical protein HOA55_03840 [archaeon]|jgi:hypothetical protein|nr:hypothetical protein [archaeon]MBT3577297.1 hypothetical protein [archaeon]MBT6820459.1 hypothetical protein [archaeon]MBT6956284.1 hypothetical protein [archaeon]MBT7025273.1 hypothetical protein [archaeon]